MIITSKEKYGKMTQQELTYEIEKDRRQFVKYQSLPEIGFKGVSPTEERFKIYNLDKLLTPNSVVLDVGCATGFFSLYLSRIVKEVHSEKVSVLCKTN